MKFVNTEHLTGTEYESYPYPHVVIDNFLNDSVLDDVLRNIKNLKDDDANSKFIHPGSPYEYNKYAFSSNFGDTLRELFTELNSEEFIKYIERLTGIQDLIKNEISLYGAGIHRIKKDGYLQLHTDFNSYYNEDVKLDRRINLLIYMNKDWKDEYNGHLCICDKYEGTCIKKVAPILNRCVIFSTTNKSVHGHPIPLSVPEDMARESIAVYYYTKNENGMCDFEGDSDHSTIWYPHINCS